MAVSYKKLWKLLIDKDMKKKELEQQAKVSHKTHPSESFIERTLLWQAMPS